MADPSTNCTACNKSSYSLLLLRPSPIAKASTPKLIPPGAEELESADSLVNGLVPDSPPLESRHVLRMLREGYVYVYVPHSSVDYDWLVYRVTENGDVLPEQHPAFGQTPYEACSRNGHNALGMKLVEIPDAESLIDTTVWIAFSANLWNDKLKSQNAANPKAMTPVVLGGNNSNSFQPTETELSRRVLECKVTKLRYAPAQIEPDFRLNSQVGRVAALADNLKAAAAGSPLTAGKEQAIVLPDPAGLAAELNALRLFRYEFAKAEVAKPENAHPIASLQMLDGLKQSVVDSLDAQKTEGVTEYRTRYYFETLMYENGNPQNWPEGTSWEPVTDPDIIEDYGRGTGRLVFPDQEEREAKWLAWATENTWKKYRKYVDEPAIEQWKSEFESKMLTEHGEPQARFETDWWSATQDQRFKDYFALHFDESHPNPRTAVPCAGTIYQEEVVRTLTPQPHAAGVFPEQYIAELEEKEVTQPDAQLLRAIVANQADLFPDMQAYLSDERQDKIHDLGAALFKDLKQRLDVTDIKYGWFAHMAFIGYSVAITQSLSAALAAVTTVGALPSTTRTDKLRRVFMVSEAMLMARESAVNRTWLKTPIRVTVTLPAGRAISLLRERRENIRAGAAEADTEAARRAAEQELDNLPSNSRLKKMAKQRGGTVKLTLLSDNHELADLGHDPRQAISSGAGAVGTGSSAPAAMTAGTVIVTEREFARILSSQPQRIKLATDAMRELAHFGKGATMSLSAHIGLLGIWINWLGFLKNRDDALKGNSLAIASLLDATFGMAAGLMQVTEAGLSASLANRLGEEAAKKALPVLGVRVITAAAGMASGFAVVVGQAIKAREAAVAGNDAAANAYSISAVTALGFASTSTIEFVGAFSNFMLAKGSKAAAWRLAAMAAEGAARRVAISAGSRVIIGLTGWGLIFLGATLIFEIIAFSLMPNKLQNHIKQTFFGTGSEKYETLSEEFEALEKLIREMTEEDAPTPSSSENEYSTSTLPIMA